VRYPLFSAVIAAVIALAASHSARADIVQSRQWFDSMDAAKRMQLQQDLYWIGEYRGKVDGKFGETTYSAITAYQQQRHLTPTGTLEAEELASLSSSADRIRQIVRYQVSLLRPAPQHRVSKPKSVVYAPLKRPTAYKPSAFLRQSLEPPYQRRLEPRLSWVLILP
jgi:peptidoglycan hydrolase-like protein with peptidoglycan-binding domain